MLWTTRPEGLEKEATLTGMKTMARLIGFCRQTEKPIPMRNGMNTIEGIVEIVNFNKC